MTTKSVRKHVIKRDAIQRSFAKVLKRTALLSMATVNKDGSPHANTAFFVHTRNKLYFLSDVRSTHCKNIVRRSKVAAAIFDSHQKWDCDKSGIQLFGHGAICSRRQESFARKLYAARFPTYAAYVKDPGGESDPNFRFFCIGIEKVVLLDEGALGEEHFVHLKI
jgi:uncharacterized protein YhbP (UPF0306 family)